MNLCGLMSTQQQGDLRVNEFHYRKCLISTSEILSSTILAITWGTSVLFAIEDKTFSNRSVNVFLYGTIVGMCFICLGIGASADDRIITSTEVVQQVGLRELNMQNTEIV